MCCPKKTTILKIRGSHFLFGPQSQCWIKSSWRSIFFFSICFWTHDASSSGIQAGPVCERDPDCAGKISVNLQMLKTQWECDPTPSGIKGQGVEGLWRIPWRSSGNAWMTASMWALSLATVPGCTGRCSFSAWVWQNKGMTKIWNMHSAKPALGKGHLRRNLLKGNVLYNYKG